MKDCFRRTVSCVLSLAFIAPVVLSAGCGKKARTKFNELIKIEEGTPWYSSTVKSVETSVDPSGYMWLRKNILGMADESIVCWVSGGKMYDLNHEASADDYTDLISIYDCDGNLLLEKDLIEAIKEYDSKIKEVYIQNVFLEQDMIKVLTNWNDGDLYVYRKMTVDPSSGKVTESEDVKSNSEYAPEDTYSVSYWQADGYSINSYYAFVEKNGMITDKNHLAFTLASGEKKDICLDDFIKDDILQVFDFIYLGSGRFCFKIETLYTERALYLVDVNSGSVKAISEVSEYAWLSDLETIWDYSYYDGVGNASISQYGIKTLDLENKTEVLTLDYDNCDINRYDTYNLKIISSADDKIILAGDTQREQFGLIDFHDIHESETLIVILEKAETNPNIGKSIIKAASFEPISYPMAEAIRQFNNTNTETFIMLDPRYDYNTVADTLVMTEDSDEETFELQVRAAMMNQLTMDLLAAEGPDIVLGTSNYTYLNNDDLLLDLSDDVKIPNVYDNIIQSAKTGKALYQVPLAFGLEGIIVNKADVDPSKPGFTFESYQEYVKGPCNGVDPNRMGRLEFLCTCVSEMSEEFRKGDGYDFDNKEFAKTAEFVNELVLPTEEQILEDELMLRTSTIGREPVFSNITSGMELLRRTNNNIEEKIVMGFPSTKARGLMINVSQSIGVSAATSCPDSCKEFVRLLAGDDMQYLFAKYDGISINSEAQAAACREFAVRANSSYEAMSKVWEPYILTQLDAFSTTADPELLVSQMDGYIRSASGLRIIDSEVEMIIREEIQAYFAGQKSIKDVMGTIQNRVGVYEKERG